MTRTGGLLVLIALTTVVSHGQTATRMPVFAGNGLVHVLVEADGTVKTWGDPAALDLSPSLGDGTKPGPEVKEPRALAGVRDVVDAVVGPSQVLLLKRDGTVLAWGVNDSCEVGVGDTKTRLAPVAIPGLRGVRQLVATLGVSAAVGADGSVWFWGDLDAALVGDLRAKSPVCTPTKIDALTGVRQLSLWSSALALKDDGTVWGWGSNDKGELCDGTTKPHPHPAPIAGLASVTSSVMGVNSIFVLADGTVRMCGSNNSGALGDATKASAHHTPFQVPGLTGVKSAKMNGDTTIVQLSDGTLRAWGLGYYGALGDGKGDTFSATPRAPIGVGPVVAYYMETNGSGSYAIRRDGTVMIWGFPAPPGGKTEFLLTPVPGYKVRLE